LRYVGPELITDPSLGVAYGKLKVFTDEAGNAVEWESQPMEGVLPVGVVFTDTLPEGGAPLIGALWGVGAHGSRLHLFRWDGQTYQPIVGSGPGGEEVSQFFGDAGVYIEGGEIWTGSRDAVEPLSTFHIDLYEWRSSLRQFDWVRRETVSNITHVFLPLTAKQGH